MSTSTTITVPQRRIATFLRLFKPSVGIITAADGLLWAWEPSRGTGSTGPAICIGESDLDLAHSINFNALGKLVRSAGAKSELGFHADDTTLSLICDTLGEQEIATEGKKTKGLDPLEKRGQFLVEIPATVVKQMNDYIDRCDADNSRYALGGMLIEQEHFVATDGRRLVAGDIERLGAHEFLRDPKSDDGEHIDFAKVIPAGFIKYAASFGESIDVFENLLIAGDAVASPIDGRYPNWRDVLIDTDTTVDVDIADMIERCDKQLAISKIKDGEANGLEFTMTVDDNDVTAIIDANYLKAALKGLSSATIGYHSNGVKGKGELRSPIEITSDDKPGVKEIIMPMARDR